LRRSDFKGQIMRRLSVLAATSVASVSFGALAQDMDEQPPESLKGQVGLY